MTKSEILNLNTHKLEEDINTLKNFLTLKEFIEWLEDIKDEHNYQDISKSKLIEIY